MTASKQYPQMSRKTRYTFACGRCRRCCRAKLIQVNPYEVARLATHLGMTTTTFIRRFTLKNGAWLRFSGENICPFLGEYGCTVHPDRPLVCRLYPLGRHVADTGEEWFTTLDTDDGCIGERGTRTSVQTYLETQEALPFIHAADLYLALYWRLTASLASAVVPRCVKRARHSLWTDMDAAILRYSKQTGRPPPDAIEERMALHIRAIENWAQLPQQGDVS